MADTVSIILLVVGVIFLFLSIIKSFGNKSTLVGVVGLFVLLFGVLGISGMVNFGGLTQTGGFTGAPSQQFGAPVQPASICAANAITSNGLSQAAVLYRNVRNSSLAYGAAAVSANSNGQLVDSTTTTSGSSASYATMSNIPNCNTGELVATVTTGVGLAPSRKLFDVLKSENAAGYDFSQSSAKKYEIRGANYDVINILARDSTLVAASSGNNSQLSGATYAVSGTGTADGTAFYTNTSVGSKGSINFYLDVQVNGTSAVAGAFEENDGIIISYDTATASVFSSSSLSLQIDQPAGFSLTKLSSCPQDILNNRNSEACWSTPSLETGVLYRIRGTLTADNGDPVGSGTAPLICFDDKVFYRDTGGNVVYGAWSSGGTNQGIGGTCLRFTMS